MKKIYKSITLSIALFFSVYSFATVHNVTVLSNQFSPSSLSVNVGDTITWTYGSGNPHTTTSTTIPAGAASWNSAISSGSTTFSYEVTVEGNYNYKCTPHGFTGQFVAINTGIKSPSLFSGFNLSIISSSVYNVSYTLNHASEIKISLYDVTGKSIKVFLASRQMAGDYSNTYYLEDVRKGIYIIEMLIDNQRLSKRLIVD
jgi:plastocyanin